MDNSSFLFSTPSSLQPWQCITYAIFVLEREWTGTYQSCHCYDAKQQ